MEKPQPKTVLITGPNGFIGRNLIREVREVLPNWGIKVISRGSVLGINQFLDYQQFRDGKFVRSFFNDVTHFVHLAGIAHCFGEPNLKELKSVNTDFIEEILIVLNPEIIEKIVFVSSFSVSLLEKKIVLDTKQYAVSKQEGETVLKKFCETALPNVEVVILRPVMVYGREAPGNFDKLLRMLRLSVPKPLGAFNFPRAFIHVKNLTSAIVTILKADFKSGFSLWEISDPWSDNFAEFVKSLNLAVSGKGTIVFVPVGMIKWILCLLGKKKLFEKLVLSFEVDNTPFIQRYLWKPKITRTERFKDLI